MDLYEVMRCAPSTRRFTEEPVEPEALRGVLENARFAPSGGNRQGWRVIVVRSPESRRRMRELYVPHWARYSEQTGLRAVLDSPADQSPVPPGRRRMLQAADDFAHTFDRVPVHLVTCVRLDALAIVDGTLERPSIVGGASVYPFVQNVLLGLRAVGLGAAFTTLLTPAEAEVRELLGFPDDVALAGHISVGHRAGPWPKRLSRNPVAEFSFAERWGEPLPVPA